MSDRTPNDEKLDELWFEYRQRKETRGRRDLLQNGILLALIGLMGTIFAQNIGWLK